MCIRDSWNTDASDALGRRLGQILDASPHLREPTYAPTPWARSSKANFLLATARSRLGALRRLAEDLRAWLLRRPWPHEAVLSRSGVAPFLGTLAGTRAYPCAPSTSHVRAAVASHGVDAHLAWESHKERNNGALVVRAMPRDGDGALDSSGYAASLGSGSPPVHSSSGAHLAGFGSSSSLGSFGDFGSAGTLQRTWSGASLARTSGASLASLGSFPSSGSLSGDPAALAARDAASHQLVDDLYDWLARQRRREVKCADLVPFYAQFPQYRKGGGQGSGIKHAILRFGAGRLMWIEAGAPVAHAVPAGAAGGLAGGDARIALLGPCLLYTSPSPRDRG